MKKHLQDWANLGRYREENSKLGAPAAGEKRVVFMGDSITDAWGRSYREILSGRTLCESRHQRANDTANGFAFSPGCD